MLWCLNVKWRASDFVLCPNDQLHSQPKTPRTNKLWKRNERQSLVEFLFYFVFSPHTSSMFLLCPSSLLAFSWRLRSVTVLIVPLLSVLCLSLSLYLFLSLLWLSIRVQCRCWYSERHEWCGWPRFLHHLHKQHIMRLYTPHWMVGHVSACLSVAISSWARV